MWFAAPSAKLYHFMCNSPVWKFFNIFWKFVIFFWYFNGPKEIFFWAIEVPKKITNFQKILKNFYTGELHIKRYNFAPGAANHTFFGLTLYIITLNTENILQSTLFIFVWTIFLESKNEFNKLALEISSMIEQRGNNSCVLIIRKISIQSIKYY